MVPFGRLEQLLPDRGRILDIGCGTGLLAIRAAVRSDQREVHGVDISERRIAHGRSLVATNGLHARVRLEVVAPDWTPDPGTYDAVIISDVLYLLDPEGIRRTITESCQSVRDGGSLIVKEVGTTPRWKHRAAVAQELLAVRVLRLTDGTAFNMRPLDTVAETLTALGWCYSEVPMDGGYPYSHRALVARRPP